MSPSLDGLPAVVTGSSRGLGQAFAVALAAAGARVVVNGTQSSATEEVAEAIRSSGGTAVAVPGSVTSPGVPEQLVATCVEEFGGIGLLVNNAGFTRDRTLLRMSADEFAAVVDVHLGATMACAQAAVSAMRAGGAGGRIVNVSSGAGLYGTFGQGNYAAAKAGVIGLSRVMDLEWFRYGVRVNVLAPVAATDMTAPFTSGEGPAHRLEFPPPESVAPLLVHLAGSDAEHLHGQVISFDGTELSVWSHPQPTTTEQRAGGWSADAFAGVLTADAMQHTHPDRWGAGVDRR